MTFGVIVVEVVVLAGTREVDLVLLLLFLSLNFFPFTIVTLAVVGIGLGVVVVVVDLVLPVWVGTTGWAKSQAPLFSGKKLHLHVGSKSILFSAGSWGTMLYNKLEFHLDSLILILEFNICFNSKNTE